MLMAMALAGVLLAGCSVNRVGLAGSPALKRHLAQGRVTDVTVTVKKVGDTEGLRKSSVRQPFLEGYIEGALTEWDGAPSPGVSVRLEWDGWANPAPVGSEDEDRPGPGEPLSATLTFDEEDPRAKVLVDARGGVGVSDAAGRYRVPFSLPIRKGKIEAAGRILISPDWATQAEKLGRAYEPFAEEIPLHFFYYQSEQLLSLNTGYRAEVVRVRQQTAMPGANVAAAKKIVGKDKGPLAALFLDLQMMMINNRLEKVAVAQRLDEALRVNVPEAKLFSAGMSAPLPESKGLIAPLARWIEGKRCRVSIVVSEGDNRDLAVRRAYALKGELSRAGVPQARFIEPKAPSEKGEVSILIHP
jgi:outer membrane protein OmpA-like peptidoglycan-associated protein